MSSRLELQRGRPACLLLLLVIGGAVLLVESWTVWGLEKGGVSPYAGVLLHLLAASFYLSLVPICRRLGRDTRLLWLGFLAVVFLGPVGALGALLTVLLYGFYRRRATPFEIWYREILPEQITPPEERLIERLRAWAEEVEVHRHEPVPFAEVLSSGSRGDKQAAIALMARNYNPAFAPAFRAALNDPDNAIRVQTASAITRIEEEFLARALVLERELQRNPDDRKTLERLARLYDEHAASGLSDPDTLEEHRRRAEQAYRRLIELEPGNSEIRWALGRLLVRAGRIAEAVVVFEEAMKTGGKEVPPLQRIWYWECLYDQRRYKELRMEVRSYFAEIPRNVDIPPALLDAIDLWAIGGFQKEVTA